MGKTKKDTKQVSYSDVAKQQPSKTNTRKSHTVQASTSAPDPEPLINLESDHSSSDETGNNKIQSLTNVPELFPKTLWTKILFLLQYINQKPCPVLIIFRS